MKDNFRDVNGLTASGHWRAGYLVDVSRGAPFVIADICLSAGELQEIQAYDGFPVRREVARGLAHPVDCVEVGTGEGQGYQLRESSVFSRRVRRRLSEFVDCVDVGAGLDEAAYKRGS